MQNRMTSRRRTSIDIVRAILKMCYNGSDEKTSISSKPSERRTDQSGVVRADTEEVRGCCLRWGPSSSSYDGIPL